MVDETKPKRGNDTTGAKRQRKLRATKPKVEAFLSPEQHAQVEELLAGGEGDNQADLVRKALHEKYERWKKKKA